MLLTSDDKVQNYSYEVINSSYGFNYGNHSDLYDLGNLLLTSDDKFQNYSDGYINSSYDFNYGNHSDLYDLGNLSSNTGSSWANPSDSKWLPLLLGSMAVVMNSMTLLAISQVHTSFTGHLCLIISLAMSDILIGLGIILYILNHTFNEYVHASDWCAHVIIKGLNISAINVTLLNLSAMAADHFLAIFRPLHHPRLMSWRRVVIVVLVLWCISFLAGFSNWLAALPLMVHQENTGNQSFCERLLYQPYQDEFVTFAIAILAFIQMFFCYILIFVKIKRRERSMKNDSSVHCQSKYNSRGVVTTLMILGTFVVCWLPLNLFHIGLNIQLKINPYSISERQYWIFSLVDQYLFDLHLLNASLDPIIYGVRMAELKLGYRRLFLRLCHFRTRLRTRSIDSIMQATHLLGYRRSVLSRTTTQVSIKAVTTAQHRGSVAEITPLPNNITVIMADINPKLVDQVD